MFTVTCEGCGAPQEVEKDRVPASGMVMKCHTCQAPITVLPPKSGIGEELDLEAFGSLDDLGTPLPVQGSRGPALEAFEAEDDLQGPLSAQREVGIQFDDLPAPTAPDVVDLPAPKGQIPTRMGMGTSGPDLLAPVGPTSRNLPDLVAPVGPTSRNVPDLLAPVGALPTRSLPDLLAPRAPQSPLAPVPPSLDLDDLDLVPAGSTLLPKTPLARPSGTVDLDALPRDAGPTPAAFVPPPLPTPPRAPLVPPPRPTPAGSPGSLSMDNLDLLPASAAQRPAPQAPAAEAPKGPRPPGGMAFGEVDLPANEDFSGVVSFGKPSEKPSEVPKRTAARVGALELSEDGPRKTAGTLAGDAPGLSEGGHAPAKAKTATPKVKKPLTPAERKRQTIIAGASAAVLLLGGVGYYTWMRMEEKKDRLAKIESGLMQSHKLMVSDEIGHWDRAIGSVRSVLSIDGKNRDALGVQAQAMYAAAIDEGVNEKTQSDQGDAVLNEVTRAAVQGPEIDKAQALHALLDEKPDEARRLLTVLSPKLRGDPDLSLYLGWAELHARRFEAAKAAFAQALERAPDRLPALVGLARTQMGLGDKEGATTTFQKVLSKRSGHIGARVGLAEMLPYDRFGTRETRFLEIVESKEAETGHPRDVSRAWSLAADEALGAGHIDTATMRYTKAYALDDRNLDAAAGLGLTSIEKRNLPDARTKLDNLLRRDANQVRALVGLTRVALLEAKPEEAHGFIGRAVSLSAGDAHVQLWLGHVLEVDPGDTGPTGAEEAYKKAIEINPEKYEAYVSLANLYVRQSRTTDALAVLEPVEKAATTDAALCNTLGVAYLASRSLDKARVWFETALTIDSNNVEARANLGSAVEAQGDLARAISEYEVAHAASPSREDVTVRLALAYERSKRVPDAEGLFDQILSPGGGRVASVAGRAAAGRFYARRGNAAKVEILGASIASEDPKNPAGLFLTGFSLWAQGKQPEAQKLLYEASQLDPQAQYFDGLGRVYEAQQSMEDALAAYNRAIKEDPKYLAPRMGRARIHLLRREWSAALPELHEAALLEAENAEIYLRMGDCYYELDDKDAATLAYKQAVTRNSGWAEAYFKLGRIYYDKDKGSDTIDNLSRAVTLAPPGSAWLTDAYRMLGYRYRASRKPGDSCAAFRKYLSLAPKDDLVRGDIEKLTLSCP
jgi:tetratricopeptide (TPR) repeat protein